MNWHLFADVVAWIINMLAWFGGIVFTLASAFSLFDYLWYKEQIELGAALRRAALATICWAWLISS